MKHSSPNNQTRPPFISRQIQNGEYYFLDLSAEIQPELTIACGGLEHCKPDYHVERNNFQYHCIEYIATGTCELTLDGETHSLCAGSLFYYGPNTSHSIKNTGSTPLLKYFIDFTGEEAEGILSSTRLAATPVRNVAHHKWIRSTFHTIQDCGETSRSSARISCAHLLRYLFARLAECKAQGPTEVLTSSRLSFENIKSYIESNYATITSPHQVAEACNISHQYLCRLFKRFTDETPTQMIMKLKLVQSMDLLGSGTLLVKQVAERVGFDDQYYFSKCFKDHYGSSPRNYLNNRSAKLSA